MAAVGSRDLRNQTRKLLERVEAGERIEITVDGRPVAVLTAVRRRPQWLGRDEMAALLARSQADAGLAAELDELAGGTTDDLPL
jgi:prevent-host-death family protein